MPGELRNIRDRKHNKHLARPLIPEQQPDKSPGQYSNLESLAHSGNTNVTAFAKAVRNYYSTYNQLYLSARKGILSANLSAKSKLPLYKQVNAEKGALQSCRLSSVDPLAGVKVSLYQKSIADFNAQIKNLSSKGVNTAGMTTLLNSAQNQILQPLQSTVSSVNSTQIEQALRQYCMFNGCPQGTNFHLDAKFDIAKLGSILAKLRTMSNDTSDLQSAQGALNAASAELGAVGSSEYGNGNGAGIWNNITMSYTYTNAALQKLK